MARPLLKLIEWEDAYNGNHSWFTAADIPDEVEPMIMTTVGFELRRDAHRVTLAMSHGGHADGQAQCCDLFTIPVGMIRRERVLR